MSSQNTTNLLENARRNVRVSLSLEANIRDNATITTFIDTLLLIVIFFIACLQIVESIALLCSPARDFFSDIHIRTCMRADFARDSIILPMLY